MSHEIGPLNVFLSVSSKEKAEFYGLKKPLTVLVVSRVSPLPKENEPVWCGII